MALLAPLGVAAVVGMVLLWPASPKVPTSGAAWVQGTVTGSNVVAGATQQGKGVGGGPGATDNSTDALTIQITSGPTKGATANLVVGMDPATPRYSVGDAVVLTYTASAPAESRYELRDFQRGPPLASLAIVFALFVVVVGRWRGLGAIAALAVSFLLLVKFMLPAILDGKNAVEVAAVAATVILFVALYATHGFSVRTSVAVLGTGLSLALIAALGAVAASLAHITGLGDDHASLVASEFGHVDMRGLVLAGVIVGALGVLNDVTVTQVSSVWELKQADPSMGTAGLFRAGMRIGRDHIGSTVNTLVLAYAGASLPLFVLMSTSGQSWTGSASAEVVAEEVVRTLVGSIGLAAAVPLTTALAALFAAGENPPQELSFTDLKDERPRGGRSSDGRSGADRPGADRYSDDRFGDDRYSEDRFGDERGREEWSGSARPRSDRTPRRVPRPPAPRSESYLDDY